jgi:hypothetical protein
MAFIAGKGFAILNSKAEKGDQKAKDLLAKLNTIDQDEADRLFSEILGKKGGGGGAKKEKKIKAPGASATDGQGEITEGAGEQAPTGKATPKAKGEAPIAAPDAPTGEVKPKAKRKTEDLSNTIRFFLDKKPKLSEFETEQIAKEYGVSVKKVKENISQVLQTKYDETEKDNKAEIARTQEQEPTGEVKPKGKDYQLEIDDLSDKLSEVRQGRMDGDADEIRARIKELKGKKKASAGKVTPKTEAPAGQAVPKTRQELQKTLNDFGIPTNEYVTKAAELDKAGIKDDKQFISEMLKLTENKEPLKRGGKNAKAFVQKFTQDKPYFQDEYQQEEIGTAYELLNGDERLTEAAAVAGSQFQVSPAFIKDNKLVVPYGDGDFEFAEGDYFTQDRENRLNIIDLDKFAQSQGIGGGSASPAAAPAAESNVPSQFKDGNDAAKFGVFMSVKDAIDDDLDFDENEIKQIANEYGVSTKEVSQIIRGYQKRKQGGTQIDTAGANVQPAGAFGDIEPETQQLAGVGNVNDQSKQQARQRIDDIMQEGRGGVSLEEAEALSEEFGIPVDEIRALERKSQSEIAFPAPDQGEAIPADQDFDAQGNPLGNPGQDVINRIKNPNPDDAEIYDAIKDEIRMSLFESGEFTEQETAYFANEYGITEEEVTELANQEKKTYTPRREGQPAAQPATFEVADENNLTPDEFQRMDFEAGEAEAQYDDEGEKINTEYAGEFEDGAFENDDERIGGQGFVRLSNNINFDRSIITDEQVQQVAQELGLEGKTPEQLTQIRNGVVKQWEKTADRRYNDKARSAMSAITAAIDSYIMGSNRNQPAEENESIFNGTPEKEMFASSNQPAAKPAQAQSQIKETAQANAQKVDGNKVGPKAKISLTSGDGIPNSLSNIAFSLSDDNLKKNFPNIKRGGFEGQQEAVAEIIARAPATAQGLADELNNSNIGYKNWKPVSEDEKSITIEQVDTLGNKRTLRIGKPIEENERLTKQFVDRVSSTRPAQPQQQQGTAAKPDRKKLEAAAADLGVDANLLEGLLELLKKVR